MRNKIYQILKSNRWPIFFGRIDPSVVKITEYVNTKIWTQTSRIMELKDGAEAAIKELEKIKHLMKMAPPNPHPKEEMKRGEQMLLLQNAIRILKGSK